MNGREEEHSRLMKWCMKSQGSVKRILIVYSESGE